ncbi:hypothetical protein MTR_4g011990 [Medicago truncatula]|uniref:Uncharacterized protein n=1 Tax=Medicago truncatula TaxID=3880 RepID=A0A072UH90_MEDTR|nr:hypothetical protein MTR_4g011990 [Medicago truncatula]
MVHALSDLDSSSDMANQDPIDPSKMIGGMRAMTQSHRRERQSGHIPKRGRGQRGDGSGSSHATQPVSGCVA